MLNRVDVAVLIVDSTVGKTAADNDLVGIFKSKQIPYVIAYNKCDITDTRFDDGLAVSATENININLLKETIARLGKTGNDRVICSDLVNEGDLVVLVIPIDTAAPKGRLILPQQQTIRDILDAGASALVVRDTELSFLLGTVGADPKLVITDSQVFNKVKDIVPETIPLTSFSILMARYKGFLETAVKGAAAIDNLNDGDKVLIAEGCTHHRQCDDIGTVKIPRWLKARTQKDIIIETASGKGFPDDLSPYKLIIHCGGCMLNEKEVSYRRKFAEDSGVPFTNYGTAIAYMQGILKRTLGVFPDIQKLI